MDNQNKKSAQGLAALGRGPDTELVHMTPNEVQGLQSLALNMGGSLTVNPNTGLPEAGFLSNILPAIIGAGLFVGTGGAINPLTAGMLMGGGAFAASGGDLGQTLKYGLGGAGGASLAGSLGAAGAGTAAGQEATQQTILNSASPLSVTPTGTGMSAFNTVGQNIASTASNVGKGIASPNVLKTLAGNKLGLGATIGGIAAGYKPPKPSESPVTEQKYFYPEGGYRTTKTAQTVASPQKDARGVFMPDMQEQTYFNPNQGDIVQVDPNALNYFGPEGTQPNFYGGGPSGNDNTAAYTPPPSMKGPFGITMNPSMNPNAEQYNYPIGGYRYAAQGGLMGFANGGLTAGPGDGMSDDIPAVIAGEQPAALSPGEFVVPADVVSDMGNGSSRAGARQLYSMMDRVRKARGGSVEQPEAINPKEYMPA